MSAAVPVAELGIFCLAGADTARDRAMLTAALERTGLTRRTTVLNDAMAGLRAGTDRGWGVIVICGSGVNCMGLAPDGHTAALRALGPISGDWGGGRDLGLAALAAAVRARDGRGPRTILERLVPQHFSLSRPVDLTEAIDAGGIDEDRLRELAPVVFAAAAGGDAPARRILDRLADELAVMAIAILRRLRLARTDVEVVLAGGIFRSNDAPFLDRLVARVQQVAPLARVVPMRSDPILGAALLGLDRLEPRAGRSAARRLREAFAKLAD
jgi:N-acetylglucosamine kinase-like BadF-type ATPase